jgi:hypothetical protein
MSDREATELKFHQMLQKYRVNILPEIVENFEILNPEELDKLGRMNNFFCGLHSFVQVAGRAMFVGIADGGDRPTEGW